MKNLFCIIIVMLFCSVNVLASEKAGFIMDILGDKGATVERLPDEKALKGIPLTKDSVINFGDILLSRKAMVKIILDHYQDRPMVILKADTKIRLEKKEKNEKGGIFGFFGKIFFKGEGKDHRGFKIVTSNAIAGVEGTEFSVEIEGKKTKISVFEGLVRASGKSGAGKSVLLKAGNMVSIGEDGVPGTTRSIKSTEKWLELFKAEVPEVKPVEVKTEEVIDVVEKKVEKSVEGKPVKGDLNDNGKIDNDDYQMARLLLTPAGDKYLKIKLSPSNGGNKHGLFLKSDKLNREALEKYSDMNNNLKVDDDDVKILDILSRHNYDINGDGVLNDDDIDALSERAEYDESLQNDLGDEKLSVPSLKNKILELKNLKYDPALRP